MTSRTHTPGAQHTRHTNPHRSPMLSPCPSQDVVALLPHSKKESKLDTKSDRGVINEVADLKNCTSVLFFEVGLKGCNKGSRGEGRAVG